MTKTAFVSYTHSIT